MATARQVVALLASLNEGDEEQFLSIALQVAAAEAKRGRVTVAEELRELVEVARRRRRGTATKGNRLNDVVVPITQPRGELQSLLRSAQPQIRLQDVVLREDVVNRLMSLIRQQRERDRLRHYGMYPNCRVLLVGPPGSGKTLTASAIAGELHLPLHSIRLDAVITRYMGETASKLRLIFDLISSSRGVYLFDEFDAIGGKRGNENDIGEMRRVLNSFLQFLEEVSATDSVVVCATNHPELLDRALFRRFDDVIEYYLPDEAMARKVLLSRLSPFGYDESNWPTLKPLVEGLSQSELIRAAEEALKGAILNGVRDIQTAVIVQALEKRIALRETLAKLSAPNPTDGDV